MNHLIELNVERKINRLDFKYFSAMIIPFSVTVQSMKGYITNNKDNKEGNTGDTINGYLKLPKYQMKKNDPC